MDTEHIKAIAEDMLHSVERQRDSVGPVRGMQVPYHGPLCSAQPSVLKDVERWAKGLLAALEYES